MSSSDENSRVKSPERKKNCKRRIRDVMKMINLRSHESGSSCGCKRLKCFETLTDLERRKLLNNLNSLDSVTKQNTYLCSMITVMNVQQRRSRKTEENATGHDSSYLYTVKVVREQRCEEIPICFKAFCSIFGITKGKVQYLQASLKFTGMAPVDKRGTHSNRPNKLASQIVDDIKEHLKSFKGRSSHYSNKKSSKIYLPEEFDVMKVYKLFIEKYPHHKLSYETYRTEFKKYNISFGYPRSDTCSTCDRINAELTSLAKQDSSPENEKKIKDLNVEKKLHLTKAGVFYERKRNKKLKARNDCEYEAVAVDYQKNVSLPNITTNDVYYRRQLSMYTFNIHVLSTGQSYFYCYPETSAKKGSNEVISFLHHFIINFLDKRVKQLSIFCDSAGGQNKNYNMLKWLHFIINKQNLLNRIDITFPIRGHSYMECDKNFGLIKLKTKMEMPCDFYELIAHARAKPFPFQLINVEEDPQIVRNWNVFLQDENYKKTCPFKIQEIRELYCSSDKPFIFHRSNYNGLYCKGIITIKNKYQRTFPVQSNNEFILPDAAYEGPLAISKEKYQDLQVLKVFCSSEAQNLYSSIPH